MPSIPEPVVYSFVVIPPRQITATPSDPPGTIIPEPWNHYLARVSVAQENNLIYALQESIDSRVGWVLSQCDTLTAHQRAFRQIKIPVEVAFPRTTHTPKPYEDPLDHPWTDMVEKYWKTTSHITIPRLLSTLHGLEAKVQAGIYYSMEPPFLMDKGNLLIVRW